MAADNKSLGRFILDGIPPAPRGVPQIEVTFDIDANGILTVKAKDKGTGKEQSIKITGAVGLSEDEIKKAQEEAEKHAAEDQARKEQADARNRADALVFTAEKALKDAGDKVPADVKTKVETEIKNVKDILAKEAATKEQIDEASKKLSEVLQEVGASIYQQGQPQQNGAGTSGEGKVGGKDTDKGKSETEAEEGEVVS
jgi:molecular chaperone DnaK